MLARSITELRPTAIFTLGETADWVAISSDAVWVGSTAPFAVHRIDPKSDRIVAEIPLAGAPCAGLAVGFNSLWIPLCTAAPSLAKVDLASNRLSATFAIGAAAAEAGITVDQHGVWLVTNKSGSLVRIDPDTGTVQAMLQIAAGSYNPHYSEGIVWVSQAEGSRLTGVDTASLRVSALLATGPNPRFLTSGDGAIWTLNQGDGTVSRVDIKTGAMIATIPCGIPGSGGEIAFGAGSIWPTNRDFPITQIDVSTNKVVKQWGGPGGDGIKFGFGSVWLSNGSLQTVWRISPDQK